MPRPALDSKLHATALSCAHAPPCRRSTPPMRHTSDQRHCARFGFNRHCRTASKSSTRNREPEWLTNGGRRLIASPLPRPDSANARWRPSPSYADLARGCPGSSMPARPVVHFSPSLGKKRPRSKSTLVGTPHFQRRTAVRRKCMLRVPAMDPPPVTAERGPQVDASASCRRTRHIMA